MSASANHEHAPEIPKENTRVGNIFQCATYASHKYAPNGSRSNAEMPKLDECLSMQGKPSKKKWSSSSKIWPEPSKVLDESLTQQKRRWRTKTGHQVQEENNQNQYQKDRVHAEQEADWVKQEEIEQIRVEQEKVKRVWAEKEEAERVQVQKEENACLNKEIRIWNMENINFWHIQQMFQENETNNIWALANVEEEVEHGQVKEMTTAPLDSMMRQVKRMIA